VRVHPGHFVQENDFLGILLFPPGIFDELAQAVECIEPAFGRGKWALAVNAAIVWYLSIEYCDVPSTAVRLWTWVLSCQGVF
jgi:hypothetical protein